MMSRARSGAPGQGRQTMCRVFVACALFALVTVGCDAEPDDPVVAGEPVRTTTPPHQREAVEKLEVRLAAVANWTAADLLEFYAVSHVPALGYAPLEALNLDLIQGSELSLSGRAKRRLGERGFVISERRSFPSFVHGYESLYAQDLPLYVTADSVMHALHRSYDDILAAIETHVLLADLQALLEGMRARLGDGAAADLGSQTEDDVDVYLAVALSLLQGQVAATVKSGDEDTVEALLEGAKAEEGGAEVVLFGVRRDVDFSQFTPRGHYTDTPELTRYFRAMMWLGRIDLRLVETQPDHTQLFHRRQLEAAFALHALIDDAGRRRWQQIDDVVGTFVGEHDSMTLEQLDALLADLNVTGAAQLAGLDDAVIAQAVANGGYGAQRISSHLMVNGLDTGTMPLSASFLLFGPVDVPVDVPPEWSEPAGCRRAGCRRATRMVRTSGLLSAVDVPPEWSEPQVCSDYDGEVGTLVNFSATAAGVVRRIPWRLRRRGGTCAEDAALPTRRVDGPLRDHALFAEPLPAAAVAPGTLPHRRRTRARSRTNRLPSSCRGRTEQPHPSGRVEPERRPPRRLHAVRQQQHRPRGREAPQVARQVLAAPLPVRPVPRR